MVINETKGITSQKSFGGSGSQMSLFGRTKATTENTSAFPAKRKRNSKEGKKKKEPPWTHTPHAHTQPYTNNSKKISTFISSMFFGPPGPDCKPHMYRIRQVFPQPVSPITTTGIPHLHLNQCKKKKPNRLRRWPNLRLHQQHPSRTKHFY